ncbi:hypothetical protein [Streptomyces jumonjinensis]|uniref:hypothetical protein n=1 Tax=Streptomyces jumonjinensis TaxID=1945 RepID=UPI0037BB6AEB
MSKESALRISGTGYAGGTKVYVEGKDVSRALTGVTVQVGVGNVPTATLGVARATATLDIVLWDLSTELDGVKVVIPPQTRELLIRLGWTPPVEEAS